MQGLSIGTCSLSPWTAGADAGLLFHPDCNILQDEVGFLSNRYISLFSVGKALQNAC
jgi:hypothetical protein